MGLSFTTIVRTSKQQIIINLSKIMKKFINVFIFLLALITPIVTTIKSIQFDQNCGGYLKQAADANSVELAEQRLNLAIDYVEKHELTSGYTSVLWNTEDENVGYWYNNLKQCQKELANTKNNSTLENTNVLMKLRESLTDVSDTGTSLTIPFGISRYPNNQLYALLNIISGIILFIFCFTIFKPYA